MLVHYLESTENRRKRLNSKTVHAQSLCSNGSPHIDVTQSIEKVTCIICLKLFHKGNKKNREV